MKKYFSLLSLAMLASAGVAQAQGPGAAPSAPAEPTKSESLQVDEGTFKEIFDANVQSVEHDYSSRRSKTVFEVGGGYQSLSDLTLSNTYFTVPYAQSVSGLPSLHFAIARPVYETSDFGVTVRGALSYSFRGAQITAINPKGQSFVDNMQVHVLPLTASASLSYSPSWLGPVKVFAEPGVGVSMVSQSGNLDGISQSFWIPHFEIAGGVNLFSETSSSWFRGVVGRVTYRKAFSNSQNLAALDASIGLAVSL